MNSYSQILIFQISSILVSLVSQWFIGHYVSLDVFGKYGVFLSFVNTLSMVFLSWPDGAMFRIGREEVLKSSSIGETIFARLILLVFGLILVGLFIFSTSFFPDKLVSRFAFLQDNLVSILVTICILAFVQTTIYLNQAIGNLVPAGINSFLINSVFLTGLIAVHFTFQKYDYSYIAFCFLGANFLTMFFNIFHIPVKLYKNFHFNKSIASDLARYSLLVPFGTLSVITIHWVDTWFIQYYLGSVKVGLYYWAYQMAVVGLVIFSPLVTIFSPRILKAFIENQKQYIADYISYIPSLLTLVAILGTLSLSFVGPVLKILASKEFFESYGVIIILVASIPFNLLATLITSVNSIKLESISKNVMISVVTAAINIALDWLLIPIIGIQGAAVATSFAYFFAAVSQLYLAYYYFADLFSVRLIQCIVPVLVMPLMSCLFLFMSEWNSVISSILSLSILLIMFNRFRILTYSKLKLFYLHLRET